MRNYYFKLFLGMGIALPTIAQAAGGGNAPEPFVSLAAEKGYEWTYEIIRDGEHLGFLYGTSMDIRQTDDTYCIDFEFAEDLGRNTEIGLSYPVLIQEGSRIYSDNIYGGESPELLYDMDAEVGDTFIAKYGEKEQKLTITEKWTVNLDGERRVITVRPEYHYCEVTIVEGIGALKYGTVNEIGENYCINIQEDSAPATRVKRKTPSFYHELVRVTDPEGHIIYDRTLTPVLPPGQTGLEHACFNPTDTWVYYDVNISSDESVLRQPAGRNKILMYGDGTETREGKSYHRFLTEYADNTILSDPKSYQIIREENGAYFGYIDNTDAGDIKLHALSSVSGNVERGQFLLYDFNMNPGDTYEVPFSNSINLGEGPAIVSKECLMAGVTVKNKHVDDTGRRVLELQFAYKGELPVGYRLPTEPLTVIEGIGPTSECGPGVFIFKSKDGDDSGVSTLMFDCLTDISGKEKFLNPEENETGFGKERDYTWVYGFYDSEYDMTYLKMKFDGSAEYSGHSYRRFTAYGIKDNFLHDWEPVGFTRYLVREKEGKVWLLHSPGVMNTQSDESLAFTESLIYDFGASGDEPIEIYTPDGERTLIITAETMQIGDKDRKSYTFVGIDTNDELTCVEGLGLLKGGILPVVNTRYESISLDEENSFAGAYLVAVYDGEGRLVFSQDAPEYVRTPNLIKDVDLDEENRNNYSDGRIFNLQGHEVKEVGKGEPYIKEGKIHIGREEK